MQANAWRPSFWARLFGAPVWTLRVVNGRIALESPHGVASASVSERAAFVIEPAGVWSRISAPSLGLTESLRGVGHRAVREFDAVVTEERVGLDAVDTLQRVDGWWAEFQTQLGVAWAARRWVSEEAIQTFDHARRQAIGDVGATSRLRSLAIAEQHTALDVALSDDAVRARVSAQNDALVEAELRDERAFFDTVEKAALTDEQARAVVCFDNRVELIASAGSGKTSTIVAKAGWTIRKGIAKPNEILLLAFNKKAAEEIAGRCSNRLGVAGIDATGLQANTFHSLWPSDHRRGDRP